MSVITPAAIPDYSEQAAAELRRFSRQWTDACEHLIHDIDSADLLADLLQRTEQLTNTLQVLGYHSLRFGMLEVVELLRHWQDNGLAETDDAALVLLQVSSELQSSVSLPAAEAVRVSALGWLPVIDNCRACRRIAAMSQDVVAAAGIALPSTPTQPMPARSDYEDFSVAIAGVHKSFARQLSQWFRNSNATAELAGSARNFIRLSKACDNAARLSIRAE